jgi:hypothetical protein
VNAHKGHSVKRIAEVMDAKMQERDRTDDPQRQAVLDGELGDLSRVALAKARGKRITRRVQVMLDDTGGDAVSQSGGD